MPRALDAIKREVFEIRSGFNMRFARHREFLTRGNLRSSTGGAVLRKTALRKFTGRSGSRTSRLQVAGCSIKKSRDISTSMCQGEELSSRRGFAHGEAPKPQLVGSDLY